MSSDRENRTPRFGFFIAILIAALLSFFFYRRQKTEPAATPESEPAISAPTIDSPPANSATSTTKPTSNPKNLSELPPLTEKEVEAIRSDIKVSLSQIYTAEKSFFSEYNRYSTDLNHGAGFRPSDKYRPAKVGFLTSYNPNDLLENEDPRYLDTDSYVNDAELPVGHFVYQPSAQKIVLSDYSRFCEAGCTADAEHFEVIAVAQLVEGNPPDIWIINDKKKIQHVQDGLAKSKNP